MTARLSQLVEDEKKKLSAARVGLWITVTVSLINFGVDVYLTLAGKPARLPNTVYALEGTMITVFASWAGGARVAQYLGPQLGAIATGIGAAARDKVDKFVPHEWKDGKEDGVL